MATILITEFMDEGAVASLRARHETLYDPKLVDDPARLMKDARQARALIVRNRTQVRGALLEALSQCEIVGRLGVGLDNIDVAACAGRGIAVAPATGANDVSVAEWVIATAMVLLRGAYFSSADVADGAWPRNRLMGREISGKRVGLVGYGAIAREVAGRARALGAVVIAYDPFLADDHPAWHMAGRRDLDALLAEADVVSLHVPLTETTRNLLDAERIASMRADAIVLNGARGGIIDEVALANALRSNRLAGAALDVFEEEPLSAERGSVFEGCPNLILTPHIAGVTQESNERVSTLIAKKVLEHLDRPR